MKKIHRIIAALTAILVAITCSGFASLISASAAATVTSVKIIKYPARTEFLKGADWDFGYYDVPDNGLGTFVSGGDKVAFKHYGGYHTRYEDLGMLDMNGLVVRVTYSDGKTADIAYKETVSGSSVYQNIYASFGRRLNRESIPLRFISSLITASAISMTSTLSQLQPKRATLTTTAR